MKYEWRKKEKDVYLPKTEPVLITLPKMNYIVIEGEGNPNDAGFAEAVGALYAVAYGIRMLNKSDAPPEGYFEYTVYPLEGIWGFNEAGIALYQSGKAASELKDYLAYKVMIRQPDFVTQALTELVKTAAFKKKKNHRINDVRFESIEEGLSVQMMHMGSYDDEPASFARMENFAKDQGYERIGKAHKEIYLSDPKKVAPEQLKTTLRFWVEKQ